jgi:general secretion pathway protein N
MHRQFTVVSGPWSGFLCRSRDLAALVWLAGFAAPLLASADLSPASAGDATGAKIGNPLWGIPIADLRATAERPLFSPSRRPPPPPVIAPPVIASALPPPQPPEPERPPLALLGTIVGEHTRIAVFLDQTTKDAFRLKVGQEHGGWALMSVRPRQADLERSNRTATLTLKREGDNQPPAETTVSTAVSSNPDMESYRAALNRARGR